MFSSLYSAYARVVCLSNYGMRGRPNLFPLLIGFTASFFHGYSSKCQKNKTSSNPRPIGWKAQPLLVIGRRKAEE